MLEIARTNFVLFSIAASELGRLTMLYRLSLPDNSANMIIIYDHDMMIMYDDHV